MSFHTRRIVHGSGIYYDPREQEEHEAVANQQGKKEKSLNHEDSQDQLGQGKFPISKRPIERPMTYVPLLGVSAKVSIKSLLAETALTQTFENHSESTIKSAKYVFPLHPGCVIRSFRCKIGKNKELVTRVEAKEDAKNQFDQAVREKKTAALLEEHTIEIFEVNLGNIPAHQKVSVQISFVGELKVDSVSQKTASTSGVIFTQPTSIAPRYGDSPEGLRGDEIGSSVHDEGLDIQVDISMPFRILGAECQTHPVSFTIGSLTQGGLINLNSDDHKKANVQLRKCTANLGRDFILHIKLSQPISHSTAIVEPHPTIEDRCAVMVSISPRDFLPQIEMTYGFTGEIIFVVDCSGSMRSKIQGLRRALRVCLRGLQGEGFFNICLFGSRHRLLWDKSQSVSEQTIHEACLSMATLDANMGRTNILPALQHATEKLRVGVSTSVLVITDGESWDLDNITSFVRNSHEDHGLHYFCLGIGNSVSHALVEGIATSGGGLFEVVPADTDADWIPRVIHLLTECMNPTSWHLELGVRERSGQGNHPTGDHSSNRALRLLGFRPPSIVQAPARIPNCHTLSRTSVYLLLDKTARQACEDKITVKGRLPSGEQAQLSLIPEILDKKPHVIHPLAAKEFLTDLENETAWPFSEQFKPLRESQSSRFHGAIKQEAESIGKQWSIASKWTSFIAVDESHRKQKAFLDPYRPPQPDISEIQRPMTKAFNVKAFPATSNARRPLTGPPNENLLCSRTRTFKQINWAEWGKTKDSSTEGVATPEPPPKPMSPFPGGPMPPPPPNHFPMEHDWIQLGKPKDSSTGVATPEPPPKPMSPFPGGPMPPTPPPNHFPMEHDWIQLGMPPPGGGPKKGGGRPSGPSKTDKFLGREKSTKKSPKAPAPPPLVETLDPGVEPSNLEAPKPPKKPAPSPNFGLLRWMAGSQGRPRQSGKRREKSGAARPSSSRTFKGDTITPRLSSANASSRPAGLSSQNGTASLDVKKCQVTPLMTTSGGNGNDSYQHLTVHEAATGKPEESASLSSQALSMDDLIDSMSTSGYWELALEKAELLQHFFSKEKIQQMSEEIANFKLAYRSDCTRVAHTALVVFYLEKEFCDHLQLLGLLLKKAKRWLYKTLLDEVERGRVQDLAREAWLGTNFEG
ncbi:von Willebrand factor type A domain-containing protein [Phyllosticta capitalensis]